MNDSTLLIICIALLSATLVFHTLVMLRIIPYSIVWGGRLQSIQQLYRFGSVSIILNLIFVTTLLAYGNYISVPVSDLVIRGMMWFMAGLFALNTLGNLTSKSKLEKILFTPMTIIMTVLLILILL